MTLVQTEPKKIVIGQNVADMQGPCPTGFHVPTSDERTAIKTAMTSLGIDTSSGNCCKTYLKLPFAGARSHTDTTLNSSGTLGNYMSSNIPTTPVDRSYNLYISSTFFTTTATSVRALGRTIRPFKDTGVIPDNTWTTLYGTLSAGIFMKDGLISISSDGTNWITIADKNLGATIVYNDGDTLSESNCGKVYQRGNNYGFSYTGTLTTSSTQVNASNYGPGNYYSSSTFIIGSADWSSIKNDNLRGGATKEIKKVYLGSTQIRPVIPPYLCFTANTAGSTVKLTKNGSPTAVTLETSTDGSSWSTYTIGNTITLSNIGDKVYWRNTSETATGFSTQTTNYYNFSMTGSIAASGDINYLLCKNSTDTIQGTNCFIFLFNDCTALTTCPELSATTLTNACYRRMFNGCTNLEQIPQLPATTLIQYCYYQMFRQCTKIKISTTQTGEYQTEYRIPTTGTGTDATNALQGIFDNTGGTFTGAPTINTTYYTSNALV